MGRGLGLVALACVLFIVTPANRAPSGPVPIASPTASPTPVPSLEDNEKRPSAVRRFFSWVKNGVTRPFRKESTGIYDDYIVVSSIDSSTSSITFCPTRPLDDRCQSPREIKLSADASSAGRYELKWTWTVTGGRLRGEGREITWDLSGLPEGVYTATVEVDDGNYHTATASTKVTISLCDGCERILPPN